MAGRGGTDELTPSAKKPRVKLERNVGEHCPNGAAAGAASPNPLLVSPSHARSSRSSSGITGTRSSRRKNPANRTSRSGSAVGLPAAAVSAAAAAAAGQGYTGGGGGVDGDGDDGDVDDPLAPYDRIERETVSDKGLEDLLHTGRRDGFLDLRRYRKPGWPRPLRVTRLEASHGKR